MGYGNDFGPALSLGGNEQIAARVEASLVDKLLPHGRLARCPCEGLVEPGDSVVRISSELLSRLIHEGLDLDRRIPRRILIEPVLGELGVPPLVREDLVAQQGHEAAWIEPRDFLARLERQIDQVQAMNLEVRVLDVPIAREGS